MTLARRLDRLQAVALFSQLDAAPLRRLAEIAEELSVPAGTRLLAEDEPADGAFIVDSGRVALLGRAFGPGGQIVGPGTLVGARALVIPVRNGFDADSVEPVRLLTLTRAAFLALLSEHPEAARPVRRHFALGLAHLTGGLAELRDVLLAPDRHQPPD